MTPQDHAKREFASTAGHPALPGNPDPLMTVSEWAAWHGLTERHARDLIAKKRVAVARIGRAVRLRRSWGDDLIAACTEPARTPAGTRANRRAW